MRFLPGGVVKINGHRSLTALISATVVAISAAACTPPDTSATGKPVVLTTFTVLADIAANVAGEHLTVESITKPGAEIHSYEPTPGDIAKAARADLIIDNGLHLEAWFSQFVDGLDVPHIVVSDGVHPLPIAHPASETASTVPNPHAWMSALNVQIYVDNIADAFADIDPEHAQDYRANAANYRQQLQDVHDNLVHQLSALPLTQRALVTCEGAFSYLARDAGLTEHYIWPVNAEHQATPQQIASTIRFVNTHSIPAVFCESTVSDAAMQRVVEATNTRFGGVLFVDSLSEADGPVPTYLNLIRYDANIIAAALTADRTS